MVELDQWSMCHFYHCLYQISSFLSINHLHCTTRNLDQTNHCYSRLRQCLLCYSTTVLFHHWDLPMCQWVLLIYRHQRARGVMVLTVPSLPTPPVFLSFYNLMLSRFLLSALMNTLQSPVMEQRPRLVSFPRSNHQQSNITSLEGAGIRPTYDWSLVSRSHSRRI